LSGKNREVSAEIPLSLSDEKLSVSKQVTLDVSFDIENPEKENDKHQKRYRKEYSKCCRKKL